MYHLLWSETQENGFCCGKLLDLAFLLVSVLNSVKKLEGAKARLTRKIRFEEIAKTCKVGFCIKSNFTKFVSQNLI